MSEGITKIVVLLLMLCFIASCRNTEVAKSLEPEQSPAPETIPQDTLITLERTGCYGRCPVYKLMIFGDGLIIYDGYRFVKTKGVVRDRLTHSQLQQLISEFEKVNYFALKDRYEIVDDGCFTSMTDAQIVNTSLRIKGQTKSIRHYYGCQRKVETGEKIETIEDEVYPQELLKLERRIDEIVNSKQWVGEPGGET